MILETERLRLRPWLTADAEALYRYACDPAVAAAAGWPVHTDVGHSRRIIRDILSLPETFAVELKELGDPVGSIGVMTGKRSCLELPDDEGEVGYWLGAPFWGRGLMGEAVRRIMEHAVADLKLKKLWGVCSRSNIRSMRVLERCGFSESAAVPDRLCAAGKRVFAMTAPECFAAFGRRQELSVSLP